MPHNKQNTDMKFYSDYGKLANSSIQVFKRNLTKFKFCYQDPFEYKSIKETGLKDFFEVFKKSAENPIKNFEKFKIYVNKMITLIKDTYDIGNWKIILLNKKPIGILMPHVFKENPELGVILNIGLLKNERGKGYGKIIHARGLELLKNMGAKRYKGSTGINNTAMLKVFKANGCRKLT
jgi:hypothetical protein